MQFKRITDWFDHYQGNQDPANMVKLYERLIEEEAEELHEAVKSSNIEELLDAYADLVWVNIGYRYFLHKIRGYSVNDLECELVFDRIVGRENPLRHLIMLCLEEVARSNWTKSLGLQTDGEKAGKVIKGPNYEKPDLIAVLSNYYTNG